MRQCRCNVYSCTSQYRGKNHVLPIEKFPFLELARNMMMLQHLIIHFSLHQPPIARLREAKYIEDITRWREDMNFMFEWQQQYLTSERSERVRYCSCHENIKFISSSHRVMFFLLYGASRLNRFFVSQFKGCSNNVLPCVYSNDDFVLLRLSLDGFSNHRSCIWKFDTKVLSDPSFIALITDLIHQHKLKTAALSSLPFGTAGMIFKSVH